MFKQKCQGSLSEIDEAWKVRHMLLWVSDRGLKIYNTNTFSNNEEKLRIELVIEKLEVNNKLQVLKQGNMTTEEFVMKVKQLVKESGYPGIIKDDMMRDILVYGLTRSTEMSIELRMTSSSNTYTTKQQ